MLSFCPTSALSSVDLPTLGRPASATKPLRNSVMTRLVSAPECVPQPSALPAAGWMLSHLRSGPAAPPRRLRETPARAILLRCWPRCSAAAAVPYPAAALAAGFLDPSDPPA